jgi:hypothetical protein
VSVHVKRVRLFVTARTLQGMDPGPLARLWLGWA